MARPWWARSARRAAASGAIPHMTMSTAEADKILSVGFAPRALGLGPAVGAPGEARATPRPPWSDRLSGEGGGLSGRS